MDSNEGQSEAAWLRLEGSKGFAAHFSQIKANSRLSCLHPARIPDAGDPRMIRKRFQNLARASLATATGQGKREMHYLRKLSGHSKSTSAGTETCGKLWCRRSGEVSEGDDEDVQVLKAGGLL